MFSFEFSQLPDYPIIKHYQIYDPEKKSKVEKKRIVLSLEKNTLSEYIKYKWSFIWDWIDETQDIHNNKIYQLYQNLVKMYNSSIKDQDIFPISNNKDNEKNDKFVPVIYQPSMDSWKNFLRQIHCHQIDNNRYEISLIFNNEQLRKSKSFSSIYLRIRQILYKRLDDIETFKIIVDNSNKSGGIFKGIYSSKFDIEYDYIHGDRGWFFRKIPIRNIHYYYRNNRHPIIFINTANHSMAQHDNNPHLWKWEYCGWEQDSPIIMGNELTRCEIEKKLRKLNKKNLVETIKKMSIEDKISLNEKDISIIKKYMSILQREHLVSEKFAEEVINDVKSQLQRQ